MDAADIMRRKRAHRVPSLEPLALSYLHSELHPTGSRSIVRASATPKRLRAGSWRRSREERIYVITDAYDCVHIGRTRDPAATLAELQVDFPDGLELAYLFSFSGHSAELERDVALLLGRHRNEDLTYSVPVDVAVAAINGAAYKHWAALDAAKKAVAGKRPTVPSVGTLAMFSALGTPILLLPDWICVLPASLAVVTIWALIHWLGAGALARGLGLLLGSIAMSLMLSGLILWIVVAGAQA